MSSPTHEDPPVVKVEKASLLDDLVDMLMSPSAVFARRAHAGFGSAFLVVSLVLAGLFFVGKPVMQPIMEAQMEKAQAGMAKANPNMSAEQLQKAQAAAKSFGGVIGTVTAVVGAPIAILILGLFVWIVGRVFGGSVNAGQGMLIATLAFVPRIIGAVIIAIEGFVMNVNNLTNVSQVLMSPAFFLPPESTSALVLGLLTRLDVFVIWSTILIAIAYHVIGKMAKPTAYIAAITLWLLGAIPVVLGALRG